MNSNLVIMLMMNYLLTGLLSVGDALARLVALSAWPAAVRALSVVPHHVAMLRTMAQGEEAPAAQVRSG